MRVRQLPFLGLIVETADLRASLGPAYDRELLDSFRSVATTTILHGQFDNEGAETSLEFVLFIYVACGIVS